MTSYSDGILTKTLENNKASGKLRASHFLILTALSCTDWEIFS